MNICTLISVLVILGVTASVASKKHTKLNSSSERLLKILLSSCDLSSSSSSEEPITTSTTLAPCDQRSRESCTDNWDPVCTTAGHFTNDCLFKYIRDCVYFDPSIKFLFKGVCTSTSTSTSTTTSVNDCENWTCEQSYKPICGIDGRTYGNYCELQKQNHCHNEFVLVAHEGVCSSTTTPVPKTVPSCSMYCKPEQIRYDQVCASDGITYSSYCEYDYEKLCYNPNLYFVSWGVCGPSLTPPPVTDCYDQGPVCGHDGITYTSVCALYEAQRSNPGVQVLYLEACSDQVIPSPTTYPCDEYLIREYYRPLCLSNGVTVDNNDEFIKRKECYPVTYQSVSIIYNGRCDETTTGTGTSPPYEITAPTETVTVTPTETTTSTNASPTTTTPEFRK